MANISPDRRLELDRVIDRVVHVFEQALRRGDCVSIEDVVAENPLLGPALVTELLWTEIEFRQSQREEIDWDGYATRFPQERDGLRAAEATGSFAITGDTSQKSKQDLADGNGAPNALPEPPTPLDLSDYVLGKLLGGGGQGDVFLAHQRSLGRRVAVKVLKPSAGGSQSVQRFLREARTLAQTQHPHIVTIHGIGKTPGGDLFLVMEFIEGDDLSKQIAARQFGVDEAVRIVIQVARAIEHAHGRGVIHRDLKPSNVLWDAIRGPVVTDFGLAKDLRAVDALTVTEQIMGTPSYMAPEQAHRQFGEISERTDVYGLAATLFALLTGRPPFGPGPLAEILQQLTSFDPAPDPCSLRPEIPMALSRICQKALAKYSAERYASVREFTAQLECWLSGALSVDSVDVPATVTAGTPPQAAVRLEPGAQFGPYRLVAALSSDQTRKVFRADDPQGRPILLKCLPEEWLSDRMKRSQFRQEVLLSSGLSHPCLAKPVGAGVFAGIEFLALEYIAGESLAQVMGKDGRFSEQRAIEILQPIAEALHLIHGAGVIYRDLRPHNILLSEDGRPMLAEVRFSNELAVHDNATMLGIGEVTSKYTAPELLLGRPSDVASDVYTLGATLYVMLTGHEPFAEARDTIALMIEKNAGRLTAPRQYASDLSDAVCNLLADSLRPNPAQRPASAAEFARRLSRCVRKVHPPDIVALQNTERANEAEPPAVDNLLHAVWDRLDPELQDAFSLAYNKKRRKGSTRISTRDLFEALGRLNSGPLRQIMDALPPGALPDPADAKIPLDRTVLKEQPLLSDCVRESLAEFQKLGPGPNKVAPVDLFVDVAKHGHGPSVIQLREHGVDPETVERIVQKLGLRVVRRKVLPGALTQESSGQKRDSSEEEYLSHDNVQFSVFRPKAIRPETWEPFLAFAHLSELPPDARAGIPDPVAEVRRQVAQILGEKSADYQSLTADSARTIPHAAELTFVPTGAGLEFNPAQRTFRWQEQVHREEFRFRAAAWLDGQMARGRLMVYLGRLLIAEVSIVMRVDRDAAVQPTQSLSSENRAYRFRRIFACVSRTDLSVVGEFQRYAQILRDTLLLSQWQDDHSQRDLQEQHRLIKSADVFQLYWSRSALDSPEMELEWRYALSLRRPDFIRPLYWEEPFPTRPEQSLPPPELLALGFQKIPCRTDITQSVPSTSGPGKSMPGSNKRTMQAARQLDRVRTPGSAIPSMSVAADYLEILSGPQQGRILRLTKDRMTIGRQPEADLCLETSAASRYHTQVVRDGDAWWAEDLQSRNGTFVNGMKLEGRVRLQPNDRIHVGNILIGFRTNTPEIRFSESADTATNLELSAPEEDSAARVLDDADENFKRTLDGLDSAESVPPAMSHPLPFSMPQQIGPYRLEKPLGQGAMAYSAGDLGPDPELPGPPQVGQDVTASSAGNRDLLKQVLETASESRREAAPFAGTMAGLPAESSSRLSHRRPAYRAGSLTRLIGATLIALILLAAWWFWFRD